MVALSMSDRLIEIASLLLALVETEVQLPNAMLLLADCRMLTLISFLSLSLSLSFKGCIPKTFRAKIERCNALTKIRLKRGFRKFVRSFQLPVVPSGKMIQHDIMFKYLSTLENLCSNFGGEIFHVLYLEVLPESNRAPYINNRYYVKTTEDITFPTALTQEHEVLVTGAEGIQWRRPKEVSRVNAGPGGSILYINEELHTTNEVQITLSAESISNS